MDDRNFRSTYYGKVGFKGIEKKSLEIILKEEPIDTVKLSQFCLKFPVPSVYRYLIWQLLLGILPCYQSVHALALEQRKRQFEELKSALEIMRKIDTTTSREIVFLKMFLIEEKNLPLEDNDAKLLEDNLQFVRITSVVSDLIPEDVRAFWIAVKLTLMFEKMTRNSYQTVSDIEAILSREDAVLHQFIRKHMILDLLPLPSLFSSAFAKLFHEDVVERVWDRVIGGSGIYLCYVVVAILVTMKRQILSSNDMNEILNNFTVEHSELILSMATDIWCKDGCPLLNLS